MQIPDDVLEAAHKKYMELRSLKKTAEWVQEAHGIRCTRHVLSNRFHARNWHVAGASAFGDHYKPPPTTYASPLTHIAGAILERAAADYRSANGRLIHKLSSAYFMTSKLYKLCVSALDEAATAAASSAGVDRWRVQPSTLPDGVTASDVTRHAGHYALIAYYWLYTPAHLDGDGS